MTRKSSSTPRTDATANIDRMVVDQLSANLGLPDYGRVARNPLEGLKQLLGPRGRENPQQNVLGSSLSVVLIIGA